jgi:hypothetical protein
MAYRKITYINQYIGDSEAASLPTENVPPGSTYTKTDGEGIILDSYVFDGVTWCHEVIVE